jgi:hypothetical protein
MKMEEFTDRTMGKSAEKSVKLTQKKQVATRKAVSVVEEAQGMPPAGQDKQVSQPEAGSIIKALKLTTAGSFKTEVASDKGRKSFSKVIGFMPFCDPEHLVGNAQRLFAIWVQDSEYKKLNYEGTIKIHVDDYEACDHYFEFIGKSIKDMNWEDLQYLACYKNIREIPLYRVGELRAAQERAYIEYERRVNNKRIFRTVQDVRKFKDEMLAKDRDEEEISRMMSKSLNLVVDPAHPESSYNFAKMPDIIVR